MKKNIKENNGVPFAAKVLAAVLAGIMIFGVVAGTVLLFI